MTADTIFRLYSMTKPIICTALMTLLEEGPLQAHRSARRNTFRPSGAVKVSEADGRLVAPVRPIMIARLDDAHERLLLPFRRGFCRSARCTRRRSFRRPRLRSKPGIDDLAQLPLAFQPGSRWRYSVGIDVAARVIEVVSGKPLGAVLRERLFEPLGMADTAFGVPAEKRSRLAAMYGRPDMIGAGVTMGSEYARGRRASTSASTSRRPIPVDSPGYVHARRPSVCSARSATISASPRCWPTAASSTASASSDARRSSSCTRTACPRRCCRSRSAACPCPATASASARGSSWTSRSSGAGLGRGVRLVGRGQDPLLGRPEGADGRPVHDPVDDELRPAGTRAARARLSGDRRLRAGFGAFRRADRRTAVSPFRSRQRAGRAPFRSRP